MNVFDIFGFLLKFSFLTDIIKAMPQNDGSPTLSVKPLTFSKRLLIIAVILLLLNLCGIYLKKVLLIDNFVSNALFFFFDASSEANIPTFYSSLILCKKKYWLVLMIIFAWLSVDETASIHEQFGKMGKTFDLNSGYLYYSWIIPYILFAIIAFFFFFRFLFKLPYPTRILFIISGFIYTGAAICFELFEGNIAKKYGPNTLNDLLLCAAEEFLEMTGVIIFIYALLRYAAATDPTLFLTIISRKVQDPETKTHASNQLS
jgi:hypothetical protein